MHKKQQRMRDTHDIHANERKFREGDKARGGGLPINVDGGARRENLFSSLRDSKLGVVNGE